MQVWLLAGLDTRLHAS